MSNNSKNTNLTAIIILGLIVIVAAITNPDESVHKSEVKDLMYSQMNLEKDLLNSASSGSEWEVAGTALGLSIGMSMADKLVENMVSIDNYVIFSITNIRYEGEKKSVGYGLFGNVFIFGEIKRNFRN